MRGSSKAITAGNKRKAPAKKTAAKKKAAFSDDEEESDEGYTEKKAAPKKKVCDLIFCCRCKLTSLVYRLLPSRRRLLLLPSHLLHLTSLSSL